jgi:ATP adenylyltransferase
MAAGKRGDKRASSAATPAGLRLWAPWRYVYLTAPRANSRHCIFCVGKLDETARRKLLVLFENRSAIVMLNKYPYNNGHVMIAPRRHVASPELLTRAEQSMIADLLAASVKAMRTALKPAGFNLGANIGRAAGAGFADHMHWHVVPRWDGDNNFMPVLASTRVLSQSLQDSFKQLRPVFKAVGAELS